MKFFANKGIVVFLLALIVLAWWGKILRFPFTDVDTWPLLLTGRFFSVHEALAQFSRELLAGRMVNAQYYRPLLTLSYGLNQALFGINPFSFHVSHLLLHFLNTVVVYFLACRLFGKNHEGAAFFAAFLFAIHPIHVENLPAIARRGELLVGFFLLSSLLSFLISLQKPRYRLLSALCYLFALLSKESAIILPAIVLGAAFHLGPHRQRKNLLYLCRAILPFVLVTILYLTLRIYVLHGMGGYASAPRFSVTLFSNLAGHPLGLLFAGTSSLWPQIVEKFLLWNFNQRLFCSLIVAGIFLSMVGVFFFPRKNSPKSATEANLLWFLCEFLGLHVLLTCAFGFNFRYLYGEVAAFALLFGFASHKLPSLWRSRKTNRAMVKARAVLLLGIFAGVVGQLFLGSSLFVQEPLDHWRVDGELSENLLQNVARFVQQEPHNSSVFLVNFPYQRVDLPLVQFVSVPLSLITLEHSVQAYLDFHLPDLKSQVIGLSYLYLHDGSAENAVVSDMAFLPPDQISIRILRGASVTPLPWDEAFGPRHRGRLYQAKVVDKYRQVIIQLTEDGLEIPRASFLVFDGTANFDVMRQPFARKDQL